jgi:hypothetical protein
MKPGGFKLGSTGFDVYSPHPVKPLQPDCSHVSGGKPSAASAGSAWNSTADATIAIANPRLVLVGATRGAAASASVVDDDSRCCCCCCCSEEEEEEEEEEDARATTARTEEPRRAALWVNATTPPTPRVIFLVRSDAGVVFEASRHRRPATSVRRHCAIAADRGRVVMMLTIGALFGSGFLSNARVGEEWKGDDGDTR